MKKLLSPFLFTVYHAPCDLRNTLSNKARKVISVCAAELILLLLPPSPVLAVDIGTIPQTPWSSFPTVGSLVSYLLKNAYVLAGILLLVLMLFGGFSYMTSDTDPKKAQSGKDAITWALAGFFVIFCSYWILQIIRVITGVDIINPGL